MSAISKSYPFSHLLWLRRIAFVGQGLVLFWAVYWVRLDLPFLELLAVLMLNPLGEILFRLLQSYLRKVSDSSLIAALLIWDTITLTGILYISGGATNPFSIAYLVYVVLSATLLSSAWTWLIAIFSTICFAALFVWYHPIHAFHHMDHSHNSDMPLHFKGMLFSYVLVAALISYFLGRIINEKKAIEKRAEHLANAQQKLAAVASIASDAAHRLGTPLATLGLVSQELAQLVNSEKAVSSEAIREDVELFTGEVKRCKQILEELCTNAGEVQGQNHSTIDVRELLKIALASDSLFGDKVNVTTIGATGSVYLPVSPISIAIRALVQNAIEAQSSAEVSKPVELKATLADSNLLIEVADQGAGMAEEEIVRSKEPFFSTKQDGMGLGVYIAELVALQLGGSLSFTSEKGQGTKALLSVPTELTLTLANQ